MRLHRLELEGFGPFRERQTVDFDDFEADGIFLISGRTGAGKSSILDGVCFALYGGVPRYDGADKRVRCDFSAPDDPTEVSVEFTADDSRWRVIRSPEYERAKKRGEGTTKVAADARLEQWTDAGWAGRAAGNRNVGIELDEILGLNQQQFLQVILLAQNRFAEFLLAKNDERQRLLRRLFGTRTYEDYQTVLDEKRRDAEGALRIAGQGVTSVLDQIDALLAEENLSGADAASSTDAAGVTSSGGSAERAESPPADVSTRIEWADRGMMRVRHRAETSAAARDRADATARAAEASHARVVALREKQQKREDARAVLEKREQQAPRVAADRRTWKRATTAESLRHVIEQGARAARAEASARTDTDTCHAVWVGTGGAGDASRETLDRVAEESTGDLALWARAQQREAELAADLAARRCDEQQLREGDETLASLQSRRLKIPILLAEVEDRLSPARERAAGAESARVRVAEAAARLGAAGSAEKAAKKLQIEEAAYLAASSRNDAARSEVTALLHRRLLGYAGELAAALVAGQACPVCGATEHPTKADRGDDPVTDAEVRSAEEHRDAAATLERAASERAHLARANHAEYAAKAGGVSVAVAQLALVEAENTAVAAEAAARECKELEQHRAELVEEAHTLETERDQLITDLLQLREKVTAATSRIDAARTEVDAARGSYETVAERIVALTAHRDAAVALAEAMRSGERAVSARAQAEEERDLMIAASEFTDAADVVAALRDESVRAELDASIREHDAALEAARGALVELELDLAGEPEALVDVEDSARMLAAAREAWTQFVTRAEYASQLVTRVTAMIADVRTRYNDLDELSDEHEVVLRLANTVAGRAPNTHRMNLESFVLAAELEEIVIAANLRLNEMSQGRYRLSHSDARAGRGAASGLGLEVLDAYTGSTRPAQSLSGGETFLASLALALGLAEVVTARAGGVRLDTLFIDEGFGSLDEDTLDLAMRVLDELRRGGRVVGVISHVQALKDQIPAQLLVEARASGPSRISRVDMS